MRFVLMSSTGEDYDNDLDTALQESLHPWTSQEDEEFAIATSLSLEGQIINFKLVRCRPYTSIDTCIDRLAQSSYLADCRKRIQDAYYCFHRLLDAFALRRLQKTFTERGVSSSRDTTYLPWGMIMI